MQNYIGGITIGKTDALSKNYLRNNRIFADLFNYKLHDGKQVIAPESLRELDANEVLALYKNASGDNSAATADTIERFRDIYKYIIACTDQSAIYLILGLEAQNNTDYAMPVRTMLYDAMEYAGQVQNTAKLHREGKNNRKPNSGEFLSGFYKDDRLVPVITLVLYLKPDAWDGPKSLYDMFESYDDTLKPYINDYKLNLISPAELTDADFAKFNTELGRVLDFIRCSGNKTQMKKLTDENNDLVLSTEAVLFLNEVTHSKLNITEETEEIKMCKALDDMCAEAREEGLAEGERIGREQGERLGRAEGERNFSKLISQLLSEGKFTEAKQASEDETTRKKLYSKYNIA